MKTNLEVSWRCRRCRRFRRIGGVDPRIESVGLALLDEVAVDILEIMHHLADQGARR